LQIAIIQQYILQQKNIQIKLYTGLHALQELSYIYRVQTIYFGDSKTSGLDTESI